MLGGITGKRTNVRFKMGSWSTLPEGAWSKSESPQAALPVLVPKTWVENGESPIIHSLHFSEGTINADFDDHELALLIETLGVVECGQWDGHALIPAIVNYNISPEFWESQWDMEPVI